MALENYYLDAGISQEKRIIAITNRIKELPYEAFKEKVWRDGDLNGVVGRKHSASGLYDYMKGRNFYVVFYKPDRVELRRVIREEILHRKKRKESYSAFNSTSALTTSL